MADSQKLETRSSENVAFRIGEILRNRRMKLRRTLDDVAGEVDLSKGFLSSIENDKTSPSVATLLRICNALGLSMGEVFPESTHALIRAEDRVVLRKSSEDGYDELITPYTAKQMQAVWSYIAPGARCGDHLYSVLSDEELVIVLDGAVRVDFEDEHYVLKKGDAITFNPRRKHNFFNDSTIQSATAIFILSPPTTKSDDS